MATSVLFTIFVICLAIGYSKAQESIVNCPNGFIHHDVSCYKVHKELFNWPEAYSFCKALNSHLVKIESSDEFHFLTSRLQELKGNFQGTPGFYVGATDAMVQDEFVWADSTEKVTYLPWSPGQPDDGTGEDCLGIHIDTNGAYLYHDYICTDKLNFICERDISFRKTKQTILTELSPLFEIKANAAIMYDVTMTLRLKAPPEWTYLTLQVCGEIKFVPCGRMIEV